MLIVISKYIVGCHVPPLLSDTLSHSFPGEIGGFQRVESQGIIRDVDWATRNVMLGYDVAGSTSKS